MSFLYLYPSSTYGLQNFMCHEGFQQLFTQKSTEGMPSPKDVIYQLAEKHKDTLDKVTLVGHSLGGGERVRHR